MKYRVPCFYFFHARFGARNTTFSLIALSLLLFVLMGYLPLMSEQWLALGILEGALLYLSLTDIRQRLLPDRIVLPLLWSGLLLNSFAFFTTPEDAIYGAIAGYVCLFAINSVYRLFRQQDGLGYGDVKLFSALGAWAGGQALPTILAFAAALGLLTFMVRGGLKWFTSGCSGFDVAPFFAKGKNNTQVGGEVPHMWKRAHFPNETPSSQSTISSSHTGRMADDNSSATMHLDREHLPTPGRKIKNTASKNGEIPTIENARARARKNEKVTGFTLDQRELLQPNLSQRRFEIENRSEIRSRKSYHHDRGECKTADVNDSAAYGGRRNHSEIASPAYLKEGIPFGPSLACAGWSYLVVTTSGMDLTPLFANAFQ